MLKVLGQTNGRTDGANCHSSCAAEAVGAKNGLNPQGICMITCLKSCAWGQKYILVFWFRSGRPLCATFSPILSNVALATIPTEWSGNALWQVKTSSNYQIQWARNPFIFMNCHQISWPALGRGYFNINPSLYHQNLYSWLILFTLIRSSSGSNHL